ncbi:MAG: hypothetical protein ACJ72Z_04775 [Pyrinomonadaceae bacterium]
MATRKDEEKEAINPRLRKKMLDRWENEGGKVAEIELNKESSQERLINETGKRQPKVRLGPGK